MNCFSKEIIIQRDPETKRIVRKHTCQGRAVKKCRHDFYTCNKHNHGCKNEEYIGVKDGQ